ncbi:MAG: hypothetical protein JST45_08610 [Bacteroidetes bacterium]|nr:hypothetical protein [Bacteroidota bacterium]
MHPLRTLLILLMPGCTALSLYAQGLNLAARNTRDSVVLRWAPARTVDWERGNRFGYKVERFVIDPQKKEKPIAKRISPDTLRTWSLDMFKTRFPANHPYAPAVAQAVYGKTFTINSATSDMGAVAQADNELRMRHTIALVFADLDARVADALGLRWVDRDVDSTGIYLYRVISLYPEARDTAILAVNRHLGPDQVPAPPAPTASEKERSVELRWPTGKGATAFTAYWIERSEGAAEWKRLNATPYMQAGNKGRSAAEVFYTDTTAGYYHPFQYRVRGITAFGETSVPSATVTAMGRDRTPPPNPMMQGVKDEGGKLVVHWDQPAGAADLKGFRVEKAPTAQGRFVPLHTGLLPSTARAFTDTSTFLLAENHYLVYAVDTAGNEAASMGGYGFLSDTIAPAPPTGLVGVIDTNGVVTLRWRMGREPDLSGYRVFMANAPDHEFTNLSPAPFADTTWRDTITLQTLTKQICYRVVAVDRNFNHSGMSGVLTLKKPDIIPPVAPVFADYAVTDSTVTLKFVPSSSPDVQRYSLYRKPQQSGGMQKVAEWTAAQAWNSYTDTSVAGPEFYSYKLEVTDSAGNEASSPAEVAVQVPRRNARAALQNITARYDAGKKMMALAWAAPARAVHHFVIYRSKNGGAPSTIGHAAGTTTYSDHGLTGAGRYVYLLKAVFADGGESRLVESGGVDVP